MGSLRFALLALTLLIPTAAIPADPGPAADEAHAAGLAALRAREFSAAVEAFEQADRLRPGNPRTLLQLGIARSAGQDRAGAIEAYERLLAIDPAHVRAWHNLGNVHFRQGRYDEAESSYRRAVEIDPEYLLGTFHHGRVLWQLNRADEAEATFQHCMALPATNDRGRRVHLDCTFYLGTLCFRAGDHEGTAAIMERVLAVFPQHTEAHYYLGMAYRGLSRMEQARELLERHRQLLQAAQPQTIERQDP